MDECEKRTSVLVNERFLKTIWKIHRMDEDSFMNNMKNQIFFG